ncbi:MAG TPA: protein kinase [Bryobacteraceae bacterium]|nr:protein kinase [Bryobacteraceae bacterium]
MRLPAGSRLGHYEIAALIGVGGMGEVYRAQDTKLRRDVALKVLPAAFAHDADRMTRFEREARVLASLSHPNIASIFGIEDSGVARALVMELVDGATLAEMLTRGPLPLEEALHVARQMADAIEYAHDRGVIHRDLKPANVKITPDGAVKVLDFGLAKALADDEARSSLSGDRSPTLTMRATEAGMILGTAAYMSPEQAKGKTADRRADIWAFGAVLFEMLAGKPLFSGDTAAEIMASAIKEDPDLGRLPAATPPAIRRLIERCLNKDPKQRLQAIGEARIILSAPAAPAASSISAAGPAPISPSRPRFQNAAWIVAGVLLLALAGLALIHFRETPPVERSLRFQIQPPGAVEAEHLSLSQDGRNLAFVANGGGQNQVWIRAMDALESRALAGTDGATYPFWSPDGAYLGFFADGKLKKIAVAGGPAQTLCDATTGRGGAWNRDGIIVFSPGPTSAIFRVSAAGGVPVPLTKVAAGGSGGGHRFPFFLPDGVHFLYNSGSDKADASGLYLGSLNGDSAMRILPDNTNALYAPPASGKGMGHLLFRREETLMAQAFDLNSLTFAGDMFPVAERVPISLNTGFGAYSVSGNGTLAYRSGALTTNRDLVWLDRAGKRLGVLGKPGEYFGAEISPDEKTVAVVMGDANHSDIWLEDIARGVVTRFTFRSGFNYGPTWSPDGIRLAFTTQSSNSYSSEISAKPAGGNGQEEPLLRAGINASPQDWSPDGKWIVFQQAGEKTANDLWLLPLEGERKPVPYLQTPFDEQYARFSPDGKWMAYQSNESGQDQVYVQAIPANGAKWQISASGGTQPQWRRDGKELFYVSADQKLMAAAIKLGATVEPGTPQPLFPVSAYRQLAPNGMAFSPSRDGQRFLVSAPAGGESAAVAPPITVVTNWQVGLKK